MAEGKRGRRQVYSDDNLIQKIQEYSLAHPGEKISVKDLIAATGVSKATWYRSNAAMKKINDENFAPLVTSIKDESIPTLAEIIKNCGDDSDKYKKAIERLLAIIEKQASDAESNRKESRRSEINEIARLEEEVKRKEKTILKLNTRLNAVIAGKDELINIKDNADKMNAETFQDQFGDLFDD